MTPPATYRPPPSQPRKEMSSEWTALEDDPRYEPDEKPR